MLYQLHELNRAMMAPWVHLAEANARIFSDPNSWVSSLPGAERIAASNELVHRLGKDYEKPAWNIHEVEVQSRQVPVLEQEALRKPFCRLVRFKRYSDDAATIAAMKDDPVVLVVAPLSGHHATLLRDTVSTLLRDHKVYVTDWVDARMVPVEAGAFCLDDYVAYVEDFIRHIGARDLHVVSVCQPTVPVLAAVSLMAARGEPIPRSLVMMGPGVARVVGRVAGVGRIHRRRRDVVGAAPDLDLLLAVLGRGLGLVQALQRAVVALVEAPALVHRDPVLVQLAQRDVEGADGALERGGIGHVEAQAFLAHQAAAGRGLGPALLGEVDVDPAGEAVLEVPLALAVAQQD